MYKLVLYLWRKYKLINNQREEGESMEKRKRIAKLFILVAIVLLVVCIFSRKEENAYAAASNQNYFEVIGGDIVRYEDETKLILYIIVDEEPNIESESVLLDVTASKYIDNSIPFGCTRLIANEYTGETIAIEVCFSDFNNVDMDYEDGKYKIDIGYRKDASHDDTLFTYFSFDIDFDKYPKDGVIREITSLNSNYVETVQIDDNILKNQNEKKFEIDLNIGFIAHGDLTEENYQAGIEITTPSGKTHLFESPQIMNEKLIYSAEVTTPNIYAEIGTYKYRAWLKKNNYIYYGDQYSFENTTADYVDNEVYVTDMFYGYPLALTAFGGLKSHNTKLNVTYAAVQSEYVQTPEFMVSSILSGLKVATNDTELIKYVLDKSVGTNFSESKYLDAANEEFINALCASKYTVNIYKETKTDKMINYTKKLFDFSADTQKLAIYEKYKDAALEDYPKLYDEIIEYEFAKLKSEVSHVSGSDMDLVKSGYYTYLKSITSTIDDITEIAEIMDGLYTYITTYEYQMEVIDEILAYTDPNSTLYKGMTRLKAQKKATFPVCYAADKIEEDLLKAAAKGVKKAVESHVGKYDVTMYEVIQSVVNTTASILLEGMGLESSDDYFTNLLVMQYANDMYDYMENKINVYFGDVFISEEIVAFEKFYKYYMAASDLAIDKAKAYASFNIEYNEQFIEENYSRLSYEEFLTNTKTCLNSSENLDLMLKKFSMDSKYTVDRKTVTIRKPSDVIESSSIYTFNESIYGSLYISNGELIVPKDVTAIIKGDLTLYGSTIKVQGTLVVEGEIYSKEAIINVTGNLSAYGQAQLYNSDLYVDGETIFKEDVIVKETVLLGDKYKRQITVNGKIVAEKDFNIHAVKVYMLDGSEVTVHGLLYMKTGDNGNIGWFGYCDLYIHDAVLNVNDVNADFTRGDIRDDIYASIHMNSEKSKIIVGGDFVFWGGADLTKGKVVFNGTDIQTVKNVSLGYAEINNVKGISLEGYLRIYGNCYTNGYEINQNGKTVYIYENANIYGESHFEKIVLNDANIKTTISCDELEGSGVIHESGKLIISDSCTLKKQLVNYGEITTLCDISMYNVQDKLYNYGIIECGGDFYHSRDSVVNNYVSISIKGDLVIQNGKQWDETYFNNYSVVRVGGSILTKSWNYFKLLDEKAVLYISGDCKFNGSIESGTVILNGTKEQIFAKETVKNIIIDNPNGIRLGNNLNLYGSITTNNNPVYMNSYYLYFNTGSASTEDYNLSNICFNGIDIDKSVDCDNLLISKNTNIMNGINVHVRNDLLVDYSFSINNYGSVTVENDIILNHKNVKDDFYKKTTSYNDFGKTDVKGNLSTRLYAQYSGVSDDAELRAYGLVGKVNSEKGDVYLVGDEKQSTYGKFSTLIVQNENGVNFTGIVEVNKLFNHNQNPFLLVSDGKFVDFDKDGMKDNVDEYPTIKYEELSAPEVDLESGEYTKNQIINISSKEGADIYYTLDGTIPSLVNGIKYDGNADVVGVPGKVNNIVLKAICVSPGKKDSKVVEYEYILDLPKLSSPEAPSGLVSTPTTRLGRNDGIISGVTSEMEYSMYSDFRTRTVCEGTSIVGLKHGLYYIRLSETETTEAGNAAKVVIEEHKHIFEDYIYNEDGTYYQDGTETAVCICGMSDTKVAEGSKLIDTYAPNISIYIQDKIYNADDNSAEDVLITKEKCSILVEACDLDTNISEISYVVYPYITDEELFGWIRLDNGDSIELLTGENVVYVRAIDEFGNIEYTRTPLITVYDEPECKDSQYITDNIENIDDITFEFDLNETNLKNIKLNNSYIEESFYDMDETGILTLKKEFLSTLQPGVYEFLVMFSPQNDIEEENIITKQLMIEILETEIKENEVVQKPTEDIVNGNDVEAGDVSNRIVWITMFISITTFLFMSKRRKGAKQI